MNYRKELDNIYSDIIAIKSDIERIRSRHTDITEDDIDTINKKIQDINN